MRTAKEWLIILFDRYSADKTIRKLEDLKDFINSPWFQRSFEGGFHFEEVANYLTEEGIAKFQALKDFCNTPEFQKILREDGLKDDKIVQDLRDNTILKEYLDDLPQFQKSVKLGFKYDPEVQSILSQVDKELTRLSEIGFVEWNKQIEEEKRKKQEEAEPIILPKANPKKWLPFYFNAYLEDPSTNRLIRVKEYLDNPRVQVELKNELKDDEELKSIASQIDKLWEDYQKEEEEKRRKLIEYYEEVEQNRKKYQMEQEEEERKSRDSLITIPIFD